MPSAKPSTPVDLSVDLGPLHLANPVMTASGTCGYGLEYAPYMDLSRLGAFTTKSITLHERKGNEPPRVAEVRQGMLNAIGLANVGLKRFMAEKVPELPKVGCPIIVNVAGWCVEDYVAVCEALDPLPEISALELNVSCPNVKDGLEFGTHADRLCELLAGVRPVVKRCALVVKLSPNVTDIVAMARTAIDGGADLLSMVNTFCGMAIDIRTWRPKLANRSGGLSGPAIKPLALCLIDRVYRGAARDAGVPIIGMGGMETWEDAVEFLLAGATGVAVGTATFVDPAAPITIIEGLQAYLQDRKLSSIRELIGQVRG
ncbi:MAG: dihydroorotate dehydrogenase [Phycisphaerales bacterium]|nr:MAG: dihydroorotate dehydrogenase [Phycisphaerales bacterium]